MNRGMSSSPAIRAQTLGVIGGGQLGRMFVQAAQRMGYRTVVLDPDEQSPAGGIAHHHITAQFDDEASLGYMGELCGAVTTEFENVPASALMLLAKGCTVFPSGEAVAICQDRAVEKAYFQRSGVPCAPYTVLSSAADCLVSAENLFPAILKTAQFGYDGKGQCSVACRQDLPAAYASLGGVRCVLEQKLPLKYEISVIVARGSDGAIVHLPVQQNLHRQGILHITQVPAPDVLPATATAAIEAAKKIAQEIAYVGVLCVEFFVLQNGDLIANEIAPRPHNSGHYSIDACDISQYELQVRILAQLPLIAPMLLTPSVMLNLLGDVWLDDGRQIEPDFAKVLAVPGAQLHLYGKQKPQPGRKMGHITVLAPTLLEAHAHAATCTAALGIAY